MKNSNSYGQELAKLIDEKGIEFPRVKFMIATAKKSNSDHKINEYKNVLESIAFLKGCYGDAETATEYLENYIY